MTMIPCEWLVKEMGLPHWEHGSHVLNKSLSAKVTMVMSSSIQDILNSLITNNNVIVYI